MGVKAIKERYRINHIVQKTSEGNICIGSQLCHDLITIRPNGKLSTTWDFRKGEQLYQYMQDLTADSQSGELQHLFHVQDPLGPTIPVYTYEGGRVIVKACEEFGWPNTTTDGEIMYENRHYLTRAEALADLRRSTALGVKYQAQTVWDNLSSEGKRASRQMVRLVRYVWHYVVARVAPGGR